MIYSKQVMNAFCGRLKLWRGKVACGEIEMFPQLSKIVETDLPTHLTHEFVDYMQNL